MIYGEGDLQARLSDQIKQQAGDAIYIYLWDNSLTWMNDETWWRAENTVGQGLKKS